MLKVKCSCGSFSGLGCASSTYLRFSFVGWIWRIISLLQTKDHPDNSSKVNPTGVLKRQPKRCRCARSGLSSAPLSGWRCQKAGCKRGQVFPEKPVRCSPSSCHSEGLQPPSAVFLACHLSKAALSKLCLGHGGDRSSPKPCWIWKRCF